MRTEEPPRKIGLWKLLNLIKMETNSVLRDILPQLVGSPTQ